VNPLKTWYFDWPHETAVSRRTCCSGIRLRWWKVLLLVGLGWWCLALPAGPARAATIMPLGDFCRKIGGDLVQVQMLLPTGRPKR
jgi:hypothetical protein